MQHKHNTTTAGQKRRYTLHKTVYMVIPAEKYRTNIVLPNIKHCHKATLRTYLRAALGWMHAFPACSSTDKTQRYEQASQHTCMRATLSDACIPCLLWYSLRYVAKVHAGEGLCFRHGFAQVLVHVLCQERGEGRHALQMCEIVCAW
jgi:hypothetical protein